MAEIQKPSACEPSPAAAARRRRMEIRRLRFVSDEDEEIPPKRRICDISEEASCGGDGVQEVTGKAEEALVSGSFAIGAPTPDPAHQDPSPSTFQVNNPKFGVVSVCGRRRDMEDAVAVHPSLFQFGEDDPDSISGLHYFGVYDGHGCSHVAMKCRDRLHELVKEEVESHGSPSKWEEAMGRSFSRMDTEVGGWKEAFMQGAGGCRCDLQPPECDAVGTTAVVSVISSDKIIVANCGDSRAVLCRSGKPIALSSDHKPDRPDELRRIQDAGGRVIFWDGARVQGTLAMSRAIGDSYLKPYVSCVPEVMAMDRTAKDECVILASDGLWDVVTNETACGVARSCLRRNVRAAASSSSSSMPSSPFLPIKEAAQKPSDKACSDAAMLLVKLALARGSVDNISVVVVDLKQ